MRVSYAMHCCLTALGEIDHLQINLPLLGSNCMEGKIFFRIILVLRCISKKLCTGTVINNTQGNPLVNIDKSMKMKLNDQFLSSIFLICLGFLICVGYLLGRKIVMTKYKKLAP